ncbi:MAG: TIGR00266 family protein [Candidatus Competibacter sp.]|nr:TIGR00266 family protein [Candidatus Competibacter sp.]
MSTFTITGDIDPFLHVSLRKGEKIYCESNAMVMMEATLDLQGRMTGGLGRALMRRLTSGESFFQQHIEAVRGDGDCLLSPMLPGAMQMLEVGPRRYTLNDGAFVAATAEVELKPRTQSLSNALFAQSGGFFVLEAGGQGQLTVSGFGSIFVLDVEPGKDVIIDNAHVVAWDSSLRYEISVTTGNSSGLLGNLVNSVTSGEGIVLRFSGAGKVLICSRNRDAFLAWTRKGATG